MKSPWLTTGEACEYLRFVDPTTGAHKLPALYQWLSTNKVRTWTRGGRKILVRRDDLDAALEVRTEGQAS